MSISWQGYFDMQAINLVPLVKAAIIKAQNGDRHSFESNQMYNKALREIYNLRPTTGEDELTEKQLKKLQKDLLESFKYAGWII